MPLTEENRYILGNKANMKKLMFAWLNVIWTARKVQTQKRVFLTHATLTYYTPSYSVSEEDTLLCQQTVSMSHRLNFQQGINLNMLKKSVFHSRNKIALKPTSLLRKDWLRNYNRKTNRCPHCFGVLLTKLLFQIHCILMLQSRDKWWVRRFLSIMRNFRISQITRILVIQQVKNKAITGFFPSRNPRWATNTIIITFLKFTLDSKGGDGKFGYNQNPVKNEHHDTFPKGILQPFT